MSKSDRNVLFFVLLTFIIFDIVLGSALGTQVVIFGFSSLLNGLGLVGLLIVVGFLVLSGIVSYVIMSRG